MEQANIAFMSKKCVVCLDADATTLLSCGHSCVCDECLEDLKAKHKFCPLCKEPITKYTRISHEIIEEYHEGVKTTKEEQDNMRAKYIEQVSEFNSFIQKLPLEHYTKIVKVESDVGCTLEFHSHTGKETKFIHFIGNKMYCEFYESYCRANFNRLAIKNIEDQIQEYQIRYGTLSI